MKSPHRPEKLRDLAYRAGALEVTLQNLVNSRQPCFQQLAEDLLADIREVDAPAAQQAA